MDYSKKTRDELIAICKEKCIKGYSGKKRETIIALIQAEQGATPIAQQDTGKFRINTKDQFYTHPEVAKSCIQRILTALPFTVDYLWVEPSAGNGAFLHNLPTTFAKLGLDLEPNGTDILQQDYLQWQPPLAPAAEQEIIIFGNPPFGRQSSLAKAFIAKSCEFANVIAFILPKSFIKPSMFNAFALNFHLRESVELEKDAFVINGAKYNVPCVFQIWQKMATERIIPAKIEPLGFQYVKGAKYDIALRRVGGLAGKCYLNDGTDYSVQSHYFIKFEKKVVRYKRVLMEKINNHIFPSNTVGPRSLSKPEVNVVLNYVILQARQEQALPPST